MARQTDLERPSVAIIGLGSMGGVLAERIVQAGFPTIVFDIRAEAREPFEGRAEIVASPCAAAERADIAIVCLTTGASYEDAVLGPGGIIESSRKSIYVHAGTSGVPLVRKIGDALHARGFLMLDAPVTGGVDRAKEGDLTVIASGPLDGFSAAEPVLRAYGSKIVYFGEAIGAAQTMKLVNNMLNAANLALASEILVMGAKAGLDPDLMLDVINNGSGQNSATLIKVPRHILTGSFDYQGWISHILKDSRAFMDEAGDLGVPTPLSAAVRQAYVMAFATGDARPDYDITEVIRHMERAAGVELRRK